MTSTAASSQRVALLDRLVLKSGGVRSEATIQSDVRMLLLDPELGLADDDLDVQLEAQVGQRRRIDVEVGCTVIEVKKALSNPSVVHAAVHQLADYVQTRTAEMGQRYVGILTHGQLWIAFHEVDGRLREATRHSATPISHPHGGRPHARRACSRSSRQSLGQGRVRANTQSEVDVRPPIFTIDRSGPGHRSTCDALVGVGQRDQRITQPFSLFRQEHEADCRAQVQRT